MKNKMKSIITVIVLTMIIGVSKNVNAQTPSEGGKQFVDIKTSAVCGMCKKTIETALYEVEGVKSAELDVETKIVTVKYDAEKSTVEEIKKAINHAGYDADEMVAEQEAYDKLHGCCKKDSQH